MVNFKKKFLSFYKNGNDLNHLSKKELIKKYTDLKKEHEELLVARRNETTATSFCNWSFVDFYFRDDFEEKFHEMVKDLPSQSKSYFKWLFLRILAVNYSGRNTLFLEDELRDQKVFTEFQKNNVSEGKVGDFKFKGEFNLHGFIDLKLTNDDKEFLKNKDIIDAGAFTGDTALPLSKITNKNVYAFENEGLTNLLFDMEDVKLNIGKLAIWRLQTRETFGSTWLSDYRVNNLNIEENFEEPQL